MQIQGVPFDELRLGLLLACSSVRVSSPFIFVKRLVPFGCREEGRRGGVKKNCLDEKLERGTIIVSGTKWPRLSLVDEKKKK